MAQLVKNCLQCGRPGFSPWVGKIPWRREKLPTPVFWPGEFHGPVHGVAKSQTQLSDFQVFGNLCLFGLLWFTMYFHIHLIWYLKHSAVEIIIPILPMSNLRLQEIRDLPSTATSSKRIQDYFFTISSQFLPTFPLPSVFRAGLLLQQRQSLPCPLRDPKLEFTAQVYYHLVF